jgi:demethylmenaquinone methyltransferase/2-methoxy-6-polyprenyl-1,4-benzoquinol methylase
MEEKQHIGALFDRIADTYDGLNHGLSLSIDRLWRRRTVRCLMPAEQVLDVAIGTADLTILMLKKHKAQFVTGLDLSDRMMAIGAKKVKRAKLNDNVHFVHGNAQEMPFDNRSFDAVTCAFGCRNFQNLDQGLAEMYRVLEIGGQLVILEFSYPTNRLIRALYDLYFSHVLPAVGRLVSHDPSAYTYLNKSVKAFCSGEAFLEHLRQAGFTDARCQTLSFGIATIYTAKK